MFYCDPCRVRKEWPETLSRSTGPCEICGKTALCHDCPSEYLPLPRGRSGRRPASTEGRRP
jgi:hypothetical protein